MLESILANASAASSATVDLQSFLLCTAASVVLGLCTALLYMFRNNYSKYFVTTLALLPVMVQIVIMLVNGNLGTGVAVAGAFSLIRFRSVPGNAREIACIFMAMALGLATGMGYIGIAVLLFAVVAVVNILLILLHFGDAKAQQKELKITIPENLDYEGVFDDLFLQYAKSCELIRVKTTNMGSLFELCYHIHLKPTASEKEFIDQLRCRNGNLNISLGRIPVGVEQL